ncbi:hypothetical protein PF005_g17007 [Phytophthora fragariae]|uniref:Uncharacterized protein n=1 Tax=Phytophthora fragariae TaxID=53985 RepID=A0A6A3XBW3_9STRA|nr:hypothetical protein PF003_g17399 [Phytophthora fragariae]KAE8935556.1 hypothetical protein PF009_g14501 [Phytophthora fragariae]KAE9003145.1 hypothetical protein PF011_g13018 [Phytophthora fragariae]KAE9103923.1 hypothetical protein PF007_g14229 [Phytophthora fragariae]KAE9117038.1 hypothetical protein PF010_g8740 [Phytophthora fragariae]
MEGADEVLAVVCGPSGATKARATVAVTASLFATSLRFCLHTSASSAAVRFRAVMRALARAGDASPGVGAAVVGPGGGVAVGAGGVAAGTSGGEAAVAGPGRGGVGCAGSAEGCADGGEVGGVLMSACLFLFVAWSTWVPNAEWALGSTFLPVITPPSIVSEHPSLETPVSVS